MKMLEWMHDKFRHNKIKPFKDLNIGSSCIRISAQASHDDQDPYSKPNFGSLDAFPSLKLPKQDEENYFSQYGANIDVGASAAISELFHGFLTIGTLGSDANINEPATPTFSTPLENITDEIIKVTEDDLRFINYELEKFLEAESKEEEFEDSTPRISNVSVITLGGKQMDKAEDGDYWKNLVCPLQGYLYGTSIDLQEARAEPMKEDKASFKELLHNMEVAVAKCTEKCEAEQLQDKHKHKSAIRFIKKMVKRVCPSSKSSLQAASEVEQYYISAQKEFSNASDSVAHKKKFHKVLRMFHRKIYPETSMAEGEFGGTKKCMARNTPKEGGNTNGNPKHPGGDIRRVPQEPVMMDEIHCWQNKMNMLPQSNLNRDSHKGHGEHWIKADEDYLVLEL